MKVNFNYNYDNKHNNVRIIGSFNGYDSKNGVMQNNNNGWYYQIDLEDGIYYYKFVIDDLIRLNDPNSNQYIIDDNGEVWSIIEIINEEIYKGNKTIINHYNYSISNRIVESFSFLNKQKTFSLKKDSKIVIAIELYNIVGVHSITALWYQPGMEIFHIEEQVLNGILENENVNAFVCFN